MVEQTSRVIGQSESKSRKADESRKWARSIYSKMSEQTKTDVDAIVAAFAISEKEAVYKFRELIKARDWKLWEMSAVKDVALGLAGETHDYGRAQ